MKELRFTELLLDPTVWTYSKGGDKYYTCHDISGECSCGTCGGGRCCDSEPGEYPTVRYTPDSLTFIPECLTMSIANHVLHKALGKDASWSDLQEFYNLLAGSDLHGEIVFKDVKIRFDHSERMEDGSGHVIVIDSDALYVYKDNQVAYNFFKKLFELYKEI
jgi:hypothetical protein